MYGAFGYDLTFQFETELALHHARDARQRDLVLYLPDAVTVVDAKESSAWRVEYDFDWVDRATRTAVTTRGLVAAPPAAGDDPGGAAFALRPPSAAPVAARDMESGLFAAKTERARDEFKVGNLFEVVLSQTFRRELSCAPSEIFRRLRRRNPSPYGLSLIHI